jgi:hypothetical protein
MDAALAAQILKLANALLEAESQAKRLLQTAREHRLSFGMTYNYIDEDIKQIIGRLHYMQLMAERHNPPMDPPTQQ